MIRFQFPNFRVANCIERPLVNLLLILIAGVHYRRNQICEDLSGLIADPILSLELIRVLNVKLARLAQGLSNEFVISTYVHIFWVAPAVP
jgi:hypothetical protein